MGKLTLNRADSRKRAVGAGRHVTDPLSTFRSSKAEEAAEQRRDQQPQPDRFSAQQDHWRSEAALYQQCCQKDDARATAADNSAGNDAGGH